MSSEIRSETGPGPINGPRLFPTAYAEVVRRLDMPMPAAAHLETARFEMSRRRSLIRATNDSEAIACFLNEYEAHTLRAYRKEVERILLWSTYVAEKSFEHLTRDDVEDYFRFMSSPPADWVAAKRHARYTKEWRPFRGPLRGTSLQHAKLVCNSLFAYLVEARYLQANPFSLARMRRRGSDTPGPSDRLRVRRHQLPDVALRLAFDWINSYPEDTLRDRSRKLRYRAIFTLFLYTGGRLAEISTATSRQLVQERGRWRLYVIGKGNKEAELPIPPTLLRSLTDYRSAHGLPPYPGANDTSPLLFRLDNPTKPITGNMVYREVKAILNGAADLASARGLDDIAPLLTSSSTHWLRHTAIGAAVAQTNDLVLGKQIGRHSSITTTAGYSTLGEDQFHDQACDVLESVFRGISPE